MVVQTGPKLMQTIKLAKITRNGFQMTYVVILVFLPDGIEVPCDPVEWYRVIGWHRATRWINIKVPGDTGRTMD